MFPDGQEYDGDYMQGKRQGYGKLKMANGNIYEGYFADNVPCGQGKLIISEDGSRYYDGTVSFANNKFKIVGKLVSDGVEKEGTFDSDEAPAAE